MTLLNPYQVTKMVYEGGRFLAAWLNAHDFETSTYVKPKRALETPKTTGLTP